MTPAAFYDALNNHDWFYATTESNAIYARGAARHSFLFDLAQTDPKLTPIWDQFWSYVFERGPEPIRPPVDALCFWREDLNYFHSQL